MAANIVVGPGPGGYVAYAHESIATASATGFTASNYDGRVTPPTGSQDAGQGIQTNRNADLAIVTVDTAAVRWTCDGTTPTTTAGTKVGHLGDVDAVIYLWGRDQIRKFLAINAVASSGALCKATFFRRS